MPPKVPPTAKRARSSSGERKSSNDQQRQQQQQRRSPPSPATARTDDTSRSAGEWLLLHERSVMALPPTPAMVQAALMEDGDSGASSVRVAAFDMDDTLVKYERKNATAGAAEDTWEWLHPSVPGHLKALAESGFLLAIFSNQSTIYGFKGGWNAAKAASVQKKILSLASALELPLVAYVSTKQDQWRKPLPGMWGQLQEDIAAALSGHRAAVDCNARSFFVGDAAGRAAGPERPKKDFSCGDRRFAHNLSLPFYTETEFFLRFPDSRQLCAAGTLSPAFVAAVEAGRQPPPPFDWGGVSPEELRALPASYAALQVEMVTATQDATPLTLPAQPPFLTTADDGARRQEMVIFVGPPSCGKSTLYRRHFQPHGYAHVNRDVLGTKEKCLKAAEQLWAAGRSVVIDNTNPTPEDRKPYCDMVKRLSQSTGSDTTPTLPIRFLVLECGKPLALHLNAMRARLGLAAAIPPVAYNMFYSRYKPVSPEEIKATRAECALRLPPTASFDGLAPRTRHEFYLLS